jgi:hypothetical protein
MSDDLVKRLRTPMKNVTVQACFKERNEAADRIEELEAKLAKSEALLKKVVKMAYEPCPFGYGTEGYYDWWYNRHKLLAELKGRIGDE